MEFMENGIRHLTNLEQGQKTGYYFDQRINRAHVARHARGLSVLDAFCYTGGFALNAAAAGAAEVVAVDSSAAAITLGHMNAELNDLEDTVEFLETDAGAYLAESRAEGRTFGLVILDPPKFAVAKKDIVNALHRYRELNTAAMCVVEPEPLTTRRTLSPLAAPIAGISRSTIALAVSSAVMILHGPVPASPC